MSVSRVQGLLKDFFLTAGCRRLAAPVGSLASVDVGDTSCSDLVAGTSGFVLGTSEVDSGCSCISEAAVDPQGARTAAEDTTLW